MPRCLARSGHERTRRRALALAFVSACLVDVAASSWSSCGARERHHAASGRAPAPTRRREDALATPLVVIRLSSSALTFSAKYTFPAAPRCALRVAVFGLDPPSPRLGEHVRVTLTGTFRGDTRGIDAARTRRSRCASTTARSVAGSRFRKIRGPLCADFACPVSASDDGARRFGADWTPPDAPAGWYRVVLDATQNETTIFCVDARVKFRSAAPRTRPATRSVTRTSEKRPFFFFT